FSTFSWPRTWARRSPPVSYKCAHGRSSNSPRRRRSRFPRAPDAPPIRIHRAPFGLLIRPGLAAAIGFTDVGANLQHLQIEHAGPAVVTLVRDELLNDGDLFLGDGCHGFELICGFRQRLLHRARVPLI